MRITRNRVPIMLAVVGLALAAMSPQAAESATSRFGAVIRLSPSGQFAINPQVVTDEGGTTILVGWESPPNVYGRRGVIGTAEVQWEASNRFGTGTRIDVSSEAGADAAAFIRGGGLIVREGGGAGKLADGVECGPASIYIPIVRSESADPSTPQEWAPSAFVLQFRDGRPARLLRVGSMSPDDSSAVLRQAIARYPGAAPPPEGALYQAPAAALVPADASSDRVILVALSVPFALALGDDLTQAVAEESGQRTRHVVYLYRSDDGGATWNRSVVYRRAVEIGDVRIAGSADHIHVTWTATAGSSPSSHVWYRRCGLAGTECDPPMRLTSEPGAWMNQDVAAHGTHVFSGYSLDGELWGRYSPDGGVTWSEPFPVPGDYGDAGHWRMAATEVGVHNVFHADGTGENQIYYTFGWW